MPALVSDDTNPEDVDSDGEDHAADALRYWAMSRPSPGSSASTPAAAKPWTLGWLKNQAVESPGLLSRRSA
jgi:hypothetical protein